MTHKIFNKNIDLDTDIADSDAPTDTLMLTEQMSRLLEDSYTLPKQYINTKQKLDNKNANNPEKKIIHQEINKKQEINLREDIINDSKKDVRHDTNTNIIEQLNEIKLDIGYILQFITNITDKMNNLETMIYQKIDDTHQQIKNVNDNTNNKEYILANIDKQINIRMDNILELVDKRLEKYNIKKK